MTHAGTARSPAIRGRHVPAREGRRSRSIVLISTPGFAHGWLPLGIARLKAYLIERGHRAAALPLSVQFSELVRTRYPRLRSLDAQLGEFGQSWHEIYFASLLFGHRPAAELIAETLSDSYRNRDIHHTQLAFGAARGVTPSPARLKAETRRILQLCRLMERFLAHRLDAIDWNGVGAVGFSCVEAQVLTSIHLARALKARTGGRLTVVFGGSHLEPYNARHLAAAFPEIDHIVVGDGERALDALLSEGKLDGAAPGAHRTAPAHARPGPLPMERLPPPDYRETRVDLSRGRYSLATYMGKGCSHGRCSFCGINGLERRVRSPDDVFSEIVHLVETYRTTNINFGDWEINGDPERLEALCDKLIAAGLRISAWAEVNARHTSPRLLRKMVAAGISYVQIGIESFSAEVLRRMEKPATVVDNVKVLRWGLEEGMQGLHFNLLCNHPGTAHQDVVDTHRVLRSIAHLLRRPVSLLFNETELYRTSKLFAGRERLGVTGVREFRYTRRCYPEERVGELPAFRLDFDRPPIDPLWKELVDFVARVRRHPVRLESRAVNGGMEILDTRGGKRRVATVDGIDARILALLGGAVLRVEQISAALGVPRLEVAASLQRLRAADWILDDRGRLLALPLRQGVAAHEAEPACTV